MTTTKPLLVFCAFALFSCSLEQEGKTLKIYHLKPNNVEMNTDTIGKYGWYSKTRSDFFAVKNFDAANAQHKTEIDSFVVNHIKKDSFLVKNKNAEWSLVFFKYGDGIDKNTAHRYDTDHTIHKVFAFKKRLIAHSFSSGAGYLGTSYYFNKADSIVDEKRKIISSYFKNTSR